VYSAVDGRKIYRTFGTVSEARAWRREVSASVATGRTRASTPLTVREACDDLLAGMASGSVLNRSGDPYKPSVVRSYEQALRLHILPDLGARRLSDVTTGDLQMLAERLRMKSDPQTGRRLDPSTLRNAFLPLRVVYRRAIVLGLAFTNPTSGIQLAAVRGRRDRIVEPNLAARLIAAVPEGDRPVWAVGFYAGLRLGEIRALGWEDVDLPAGVIRVERSWDALEGFVAPKSLAGRRSVPIPGVLRGFLELHRAAAGGSGGLVFGRTHQLPFNVSSLYRRARAAWRDAELEPLTLHETRHTFASLMIAAGVSPKELQVFMRHASVTITLDRYGHLFPGSHAAAASLLDAYLDRARVTSDG
jgi:integrase